MILLERLSSESLLTDVLVLLLRVVSLRWEAAKPLKLHSSLIGASSQPEWIVSIFLVLAVSSVLSFLQVFSSVLGASEKIPPIAAYGEIYSGPETESQIARKRVVVTRKVVPLSAPKMPASTPKIGGENRSRDILERAFDDGIV